MIDSTSMKTITAFLLVFLISLTQLYAQEDQGFKAGVQFGMTGTQVTGDALSGFNKAGLFAGFLVNRAVGKLGDFQLEMNFIQKGSRKNAQPSKGILDAYLLRLNYIEIPIMYRFKIVEPLSIEVGLQLAYLISSSEYDINGIISTDPTVEGFKKLDFSAFTGLHYQINKHIGISFRYGYSILAIRPKPQNVHYRYDAGQFNEVLCTAFQYEF